MNIFTLTVSCPQRPGIVHAITRFLFQHQGDIVEHQQFDDAVRGHLFLRTEFRVDGDSSEEQLDEEFASIADEFGMSYHLRGNRVPRVLVMVSKQGHCLNDLVFRWRSGTLDGDLAAVVSNHDDLRSMAEAAGLPFHRIPVTAESKPQAEAQLLKLVDDLD